MKISSIIKSIILVISYIYFIKFTVIWFFNNIKKARKQFGEGYIYDIVETLFYIAIFIVALGFLYLIVYVIYYALMYNI